MSSAVIGQTGSVVLSDDSVWHPVSQKRAVRYRIVGRNARYRAEVIGPFHSRLYGACSYGTTKDRAKVALKNRLMNSYGYHGFMLLSGVDESDTVGLSAVEIWHRANNPQREALKNLIPAPITLREAIGSAGM